MKGKITAIHPIPPKNVAVTIHVAATPQNLERYMDKPIEITLEEYREKRSLQANKFLWACIGDICTAVHEDKDRVYLDLLRHYGQYTLIRIPAEALDILKRQWRETEVVGEIDGKVDVLCYFGSHTYNSKYPNPDPGSPTEGRTPQSAPRTTNRKSGKHTPGRCTRQTYR